MSKTKPRKPRALSLCSGIGGIDLAAEWAGFEIVGQCEIDPFCQQVLAKHWHGVKRVADIREVWGDTFDGAIDLLMAGFPCPPVSVAGKRRGAADARWLWPEVCRAIQIYEPTWVVLENVAGLISLGLDDVLADLDAAGYESWPVVFPAAAIGAPHPRERVFIVAHAYSERRSQPQGHVSEVGRWALDRREDVAHAHVDRCGIGQGEPLAIGGSRGTSDAGAADQADVADTAGARLSRGRRPQRTTRGTQAGARVESEPQRRSDVVHADGAGWPESHATSLAGVMGHPARRPHQDRRDGQAQSRMGGDADGLPRRLDGSPRHAWPALPGHAQHEWEPPRTTQERIPNRAKRLTALGNAVVPQQVYPILAAIREVMD